MASVEHGTALERELLTSIAGGDAGALTVLYERMRAPLLAYLTLLVRDKDVAEEVLQDTILAVWRGAGHFRNESSVRSWVFAIGRRRAIDRLRKTHDRLENDGQLATRIDDRPGPEELAISNATQAEIETAIRTLPRIHQEVLMLLFAYELSYTELSSVLSVPLGTVKSRVSNARKALRRQLSQSRSDLR
jgi:RNA polymerase sigma-70 factor (ECF subfamily)